MYTRYDTQRTTKKPVGSFPGSRLHRGWQEEDTSPSGPARLKPLFFALFLAKIFRSAKRVLMVLRNETFRVMDFFCAIRYYKDYTSNKKPLRFDYYMVRFRFAERGWLETQIFHERGPRYVSPNDLTVFLLKKVNEASARGILKQVKRS